MSNTFSVIENSSNFPSDIRSRLQQRIVMFCYLVILDLIVGAWYLHWRIFYSLNFDALWLSIPLLLAEIYSYIGGVIFLVGLWQPNIQQIKVFEQVNSSWCNLFSWSQKMKKIQAERSQLVSRLEQINNLVPEISQAEQFLKSFQLQVNTDTKALAQVLTWFEGLKQSFIPTKVWLECQTVLGEAFDNVVCHAHEGMPKETPVELKVEIFNHSLIIKIWDHGSGFDLDAYRQQKEKEPINQYAENGRGIQIITEVADYCSYTHQADARNCLLILKSFVPITTQQQQNYPTNLLGYLHSFRQLILLSNPQYKQIKDYLLAEKKLLEYSIDKKEIELNKLNYFADIFKIKIINIFWLLGGIIFIVSPLIYLLTGIIPLQSYNTEFALHFIPAIGLNYLTFFVITWGIITKNILLCQPPIFIWSGLETKKNFSFTLIILLTIIGVILGGYKLLNDNFCDFSYYLINAFWAIYNLLVISVIIKIGLASKITL